MDLDILHPQIKIPKRTHFVGARLSGRSQKAVMLKRERSWRLSGLLGKFEATPFEAIHETKRALEVGSRGCTGHRARVPALTFFILGVKSQSFSIKSLALRWV